MREVKLEMLSEYFMGNGNRINWRKIKNAKVDFIYDDIEGTVEISYKNMKKGNVVLEVIYGDTVYEMLSSNFKKCKFAGLLGKRNYTHKYNIGDIVNGCEVKALTKRKDSRNNNILTYQMLCLTSNQEFEITQYNLLYGYGSPYISGKTVVWEENWLYNKKEVLQFLDNPEDAKKYSFGSDRRILCKCPNCNKKQEKIVGNLVRFGFACNYCRPTLSFPELFVTSYLKLNKIQFIPQKEIKINGRTRYFDFFLPELDLAIETHGIQHYEQVKLWKNAYERTQKSDAEKRIYCKENNITLVELDCRKSNLKYITNSINKSPLPNISPVLQEQISQEISKIKY